MATKIGTITSIGRTGSTFTELYLDTGDRVELKHSLWEHVRSSYSPDAQLVFVERRGRAFNFVQWVGTPAEARTALERGSLKASEVPVELLQNAAPLSSSPALTDAEDEPGESDAAVEGQLALLIVQFGLLIAGADEDIHPSELRAMGSVHIELATRAMTPLVRRAAARAISDGASILERALSERKGDAFDAFRPSFDRLPTGERQDVIRALYAVGVAVAQAHVPKGATDPMSPVEVERIVGFFHYLGVTKEAMVEAVDSYRAP